VGPAARLFRTALAAVHEALPRVFLEHETDAAERDVTASLARQATDCRQLHLFTRIVQMLEESTDALTPAASWLRPTPAGMSVGG
jgi:hypothetical protein